MLGRVFSESEYMALKTAFRRLTKAVGGQESAASVTRVDFQRIGRYARPNEPSFAPIDVVADLEADLGNPMITRVLADMQGYILIAKPPVEGERRWIEHLGALGKEAGEAIARLSEAFADGGTITAEDVRKLELPREISETMEVLARIDSALKALLINEDETMKTRNKPGGK